MQRIWSCGERCLGLWTLNESSEAVRSLRYLCRCGGSGEYATRSSSIRFACFINPCSWSWQCAINSHLRESRTVQDIYLVTCGNRAVATTWGRKVAPTVTAGAIATKTLWRQFLADPS
ncbi:unnamed protein product [Sphagnum troendelagicum]|uniref:Uncharacterized protein n=1 Tax=Sphagnum troendelagicum TaxID=128251 RepID=A0ABP0TZH2_9BRYO